MLSSAHGGLIVDMAGSWHQGAAWRVAIYAREAPDRAGRRRLDRQVAGLCAQVARRPGWRHIATYGDLDVGHAGTRPGLCRLLGEAPGRYDLVVIDRYDRPSANRQELGELLDHLLGSGVQVVALYPSARRRLARLVANVALADLIGEAAR